MRRHMLMRMRGALACAAAALAVACGGSSPASPSPGATSASAQPSATASATPTPALASASPTPQPSPTIAESVAVAQQLFPLRNGLYSECDNGLNDTSGCPFSARLHAQIQTYRANYARQCPQGCGGALLLLRQQCGGFAHESVTTPQNPSIAIATLTGNDCLGASQTMYVIVIIENGAPVADDVQCNVGDPKYGMYNADPNATSGMPCAATSS